MRMSKKVRIIIADDHKIVRQGLHMMFAEDETMEVVGEAETGRQAIDLAHLHKPDVMTMDIGFPDMNGVAVTREIMALNPAIKVIALSMHADRYYVVEAIRAGAKAFLLKDCAFNELMAAIKAVIGGHRYLCQAVTGIVVDDVICGDNTGNANSLSKLTDREIVVLRKMTEGATAKEIGASLNVASTTIATHQQRLKRKLGISNIVELTKLAIREGLTPLDSKVSLPSSHTPKIR